MNIKKEFLVGQLAQPAIKNLSCEIKEREFVILSGRSGSGKSTLLNLMAGLENPDEGQIFFEGDHISKMTDTEISRIRLKKIGFIFQTFNLIPVLTAFENIEYPLIFLKMSRSERRERTQDIIEKVGLAKHHRSLPSQLSGGQRQRVAIARALVKEPTLVLADEPTANLDVQTSGEIIGLIEDLYTQRKSSIIFCTHDSKMISRGTRWIEMRDGEIIHDRKKDDL